MSTRHDRIRNLGAAGVLAVVAALLAALALPHHGSKAQAAEPAKAPVLIATQDLKVGTAVAAALQRHALVVERVPNDALNAGAVASAAAVMHDVVVQPIFAGEQVTARRLGATGEAGIHSVLSGSERIIQVAGDPDQLLAGSVRDGDHVDILASIKAGNNATSYTAYAARNVIVLDAPGDSSSDTTDSSSSSVTATVELTDAQAAALFYVMKNGDWAFVLRPATHPGKTSNPAVGAGAILKGGS